MTKLRRALVVAASCAVVAAPLGAQASGEAKVRAVVEQYLHGLKFNDVASFKAAFWPDAKLYWVKRDSTLGQLSQEEWYKSFVAVAGKEEPGELSIVSVNVTDNAASVKVLETYPKSLYVDYLNLLRINGEWRIVNKIYTSRTR
jgi:hypothetical protein